MNLDFNLKWEEMETDPGPPTDWDTRAHDGRVILVAAFDLELLAGKMRVGFAVYPESDGFGFSYEITDVTDGDDLAESFGPPVAERYSVVPEKSVIEAQAAAIHDFTRWLIDTLESDGTCKVVPNDSTGEMFQAIGLVIYDEDTDSVFKPGPGSVVYATYSPAYNGPPATTTRLGVIGDDGEMPDPS